MACRYKNWKITERFENGNLIREDSRYGTAVDAKEILLLRVQRVKFYCPSIFKCGTERIEDIVYKDSSYTAFADMGTWKVNISAVALDDCA